MQKETAPQFTVAKSLKPSGQDDVKYVRFECRSITPLFMDPMTPPVVFSTLVQGKRPPADKTTPLRERCEEKLYRSADGDVGLPAEVLFACLEAGSRSIKVGRKALGTKESSELGSILKILDPFVAFPEDSREWVEDCRRGMGKTGIANGICRPRFDTWRFTFTVEANLGQIDGLQLQHIVDLVDRAGRQKGVGAFRKRYGRFMVAKAELLEVAKEQTLEGNGEA